MWQEGNGINLRGHSVSGQKPKMGEGITGKTTVETVLGKRAI